MWASTVESQERVAVDVAEAAVKFLKDGMITNAINAPRGKLDPEIAPFIPLAEDLGIIAQQLVGSNPIKEMEVIYGGNVAQKDTKRIGIAATIGVLTNIIGEKANMINAQSVAKGKGIQIKESKIDASDKYDDYVIIKLLSGTGSTTEVKGTVFAGIPRLVAINGFTFEMPIEKSMFVALYKDVPGVIGTVGKLFGDANINIAQMAVGRDEPQGKAVMVVSLDHKVDDALAKKIVAGGFEKAKFITL